MFTKLKKKIAEEAAIAPRPGGATRIPRSLSKESITSAGADSGDDFASDGSSSRDDLPSQISRRNDQIRRLEAKLSDYAEQVRNLQKMKEKLELALEKHQDSTLRKFQEQNEAHQAHRAKMAEEHALALEKKDQLLNKEEVLSQVEQELELLRTEVVATRAECQNGQELSTRLKEDLQKVQKENDMLSQRRIKLTTAQEGAEKKITELEQRQQELQDFIQQLSLDLQKAQSVGCCTEKRLTEVQEKYEALHLHHEQFKHKVGVQIEEKDALIVQLQERVNLLEKTLEGSFSGDKRLQELLKEKDTLEIKLDQTRQQLLEAKTLHSDSVSQMESQVATLIWKLHEAQDLLQQKETKVSCFKEESYLKEELSSNVEIAKALEETRKQKEDLQKQVANFNARIEENTQEISLRNEELIRKNEEAAILTRDYDSLVLQMQELHCDLEKYKTRAVESEESSARRAFSVMDHLHEQKVVLLATESQVSSLQEAVAALHEPLNGTASVKSNGEVGVGDIPQLQRENQELEQQIVEKNKTIKQLQQRMVELKKTLQKELKLKPEPEVNDVREKPNPDSLATSLTVTISSDLTDSREINFEYLKHVVLKFMSAREAEAFHLIKAVSVLLNFSVEEENLLKETLEYKMSWFGSKPVPKGTLRPSISKSRTTWS